MGTAVVRDPLRRVAQPEVSAEIDDHDVLGQLRRDGGRLAVRQCEEDDVGLGEPGRVGRLEHPPGVLPQVRVHRRHQFAGVARRP